MARVTLRLVMVAATGALLAGCGESGAGETTTTGAPTVPAQALVKDPESCLRTADLDRAEQREPRVWRGFGPGRTVVIVESVGPGIATNEAKRATDVWAYAVGPYFVHGTGRAAAGRSTKAVADCLRVGRTSSDG